MQPNCSMVLVNVAAVDAARRVPATGGRPLGVQGQTEVFRLAPTPAQRREWLDEAGFQSRCGATMASGVRGLGRHPLTTSRCCFGLACAAEFGSASKRVRSKRREATVPVTASFWSTWLCWADAPSPAWMWRLVGIVRRSGSILVVRTAQLLQFSETLLNRGRKSGSRSEDFAVTSCLRPASWNPGP